MHAPSLARFPGGVLEVTTLFSPSPPCPLPEDDYKAYLECLKIELSMAIKRIVRWGWKLHMVLAAGIRK